MLNWSWFTARRLQTQLLVWTALILIVTVVAILEVRTRRNVRLLEGNLQTRSETVIETVDQTLGLHFASQIGTLPTEVIQERLSEFTDADPTLVRLDVVQNGRDGMVVVASSNKNAEVLVDTLSATPVTVSRYLGSDHMMITSKAVEGTNYGVVAVATLENVDRYEAFNRGQLPTTAGILILVLTTLMHVMYKRTVSRRIDELIDGIDRAKRGQAARIPDAKVDEIGVIAKTLNGLIAQVQSFNEELRSQIATATEDLNQRNIALEESTRQMVDMQQQLLESERLATVGQMAATFAHEIGSPMASLSAHVQLLLEDPRLSEDQRETLGIVREQIQAVVQIVNEMLRSARRGPSDFVLIDINEILRTVVRLVHPKLMSQKIYENLQLDPIPLVRGYQLYLQEAFLNIINNASDAMPAGGRLDVRCWFETETGMVHIRITDTGPGIDESVVEKMFDHFVTTKRIGEGTGLGLGIVKEIVDSHRGTFHIGPADGKGTAAHIMFPAETTTVLVS